jgi:hypothetical protein
MAAVPDYVARWHVLARTLTPAYKNAADDETLDRTSTPPPVQPGEVQLRSRGEGWLWQLNDRRRLSFLRRSTGALRLPDKRIFAGLRSPHAHR